MATATKKNASPSSRPDDSRDPETRSRSGGPLRVVDAIYRFLASLKLAVFSLATLAAVLAYATFFESWYGPSAVQEWIYQTKGFALLLAFLGINILCAALIRFPWKKRQTGFVITHAGLLILLAGSFWSLKTADEGQVGELEGETKKELLRLDYPVIRVRTIDAHTQQPTEPEFDLPFRPGNFAWGPGSPRPRTIFGTIFAALTGGLAEKSFDGEILSLPGDPFVFKVKSHLPASVWATIHVPDPAGIPMVKIHPRTKAPRMPQAMDVFETDEECWFAPRSERDTLAFQRFHRIAKTQGPAQFAFLYVNRPEMVEDFLNPPKGAGAEGVARIRYADRAGKARTFDWNLTGQQGKSMTLPDSDVSVAYEGTRELPAEEMGLERLLGEPAIQIASFKVRQGKGPEVLHHGWASLPMLPNVIPTQEEKHPKAIVAIHYFVPPEVNPKTNGRFGVVEVLGTPEGKLYSRVFGRGANGLGELRSPPGPLAKGKDVVAFGGNPNMPMTLTFQVEEYLPAGRENQVCEPIPLPKGQQSGGIAASLVEMTVKGDDDKTHTKEFWIRRSATFDPVPQRVSFPTGDYEVSYDVDRKPLGFSLKLDDFKVEFDPGTDRASSFVSQVRLTDETMGIKNQPHTISMNEPLTHRGYTFYQASYNRETVPNSRRETGRFQSIFQVGTDPGRMTKYLGCLLVVLGAFVQFYMRAGLFTDGGKRERARAEAKARKRAQANGVHQPESDVALVTESEEPL